MKSRLAEAAKLESLEHMQQKTAEERLAAFLEHCQWTAQLSGAGRAEQPTQSIYRPRSAD